MVALVAPQDGHRIYDPVCGSAGLLIDSVRHVYERTGLDAKLSLTGQDLHAGTLQIAQMNLAVHGVEAHLELPVDSLAQPTNASYDIVLANPPFNMAPWGPEPLRRGIHGGRTTRPRLVTTRTTPGSCILHTHWPRRAGQPS